MCVCACAPPPVSLHLAPKRGAVLRFRPSCRAAHPTPLFIRAFKSPPLLSGGKEMLPGWMRAIKATTGKAGACLAGCTAWAWWWCKEYGPGARGQAARIRAQRNASPCSREAPERNIAEPIPNRKSADSTSPLLNIWQACAGLSSGASSKADPVTPGTSLALCLMKPV